jgi:hypothetical protein
MISIINKFNDAAKIMVYTIPIVKKTVPTAPKNIKLSTN